MNEWSLYAGSCAFSLHWLWMHTLLLHLCLGLRICEEEESIVDLHTDVAAVGTVLSRIERSIHERGHSFSLHINWNIIPWNNMRSHVASFTAVLIPDTLSNASDQSHSRLFCLSSSTQLMMMTTTTTMMMMWWWWWWWWIGGPHYLMPLVTGIHSLNEIEQVRLYWQQQW